MRGFVVDARFVVDAWLVSMRGSLSMGGFVVDARFVVDVRSTQERMKWRVL
jgi:hypothetical protein